MSVQCKFNKPWRAHRQGDIVRLRDGRAEELERTGVLEILSRSEETPAPESDGKAIINDLRQKLQAAEQQCREWRAKYEQLANQPPGSTPAPAQTESSDAQPDAEDQAGQSAAQLFPELDLPEPIKQKMADAGWKTTADVVAAAGSEGGLQSAQGIGKMIAQQISEELAKLSAE